MTNAPSTDEARVGHWWRTLGPFAVALAWLTAGYLHYAPGAAYSLSAEHYRAWSFPAFRYSDIIWLYLRDGLAERPIPYLDYPLEYPPLTGLLSWSLSWLPDLPAYFLGAYLVLGASALATVWALQHLAGANVWLFAASPALFFYTGHQWDLAAIAVTALSLLALQRQRPLAAVAGLAAATSLKLFPVVFFVALLVENLRDRRWRQAAGNLALFAAVIAATNVPVLAASRDGWSFFIRWNRDRLADSGLWVLWRDVPTADLTRWSMVAAIAGGLALTTVALRQRGPLTVPLGAAFLVWWLLVNKTFTTHLVLWVVLALALVSAPLWLWGLVSAVDIVGFQLGNYLNLYNIDAYRHAPLIRKAVENIYDPVQLARTGVLGTAAIWFTQLLRAPERRRSFVAGPRSAQRERRNRSFPSMSGASLSRTDAWRGAVVAVAVLTLSTVVMTWPYAAHAADSTVVGFDPFLQIWLSEWVQHALLTNPRELFAANMFYPFAQTLAYTDANIPGALLALPLRVMTGDPVLTNSLLVLGSFVLAGLGVFLLARHLTGNQAVSLIAGAAYAFLPYRMVHLWHLNWLEGALLPWLILALVRVLERPTPGRALTAGVLAALLTLVSFYFAPQIALVSVALAAGLWVSRRTWPDRAFWAAATLAVFTAVVTVTPVLLPYLAVNQEQRLERSLADAEQYKAFPESYLQLVPWREPSPAQRALGLRSAPNESLTEVGQAVHTDGHQHAEIVSEDALFPGLVVLLGAVLALAWGRPRWLVVSLATTAAVAWLLSLGPSWGPRHGANPPLPYAWLFDHAPFFRAMRVPARLGGLVGLALVVLASLGLSAAWERLSPRLRPSRRVPIALALSTLVLAVVLAEFWTGSVPLERVDRSSDTLAGARWLASQPAGPVMEFPAESVFADPAAASVRRHTGETLLRSTLHWLPVVNGNSGFIPRAYSDFIERFVGPLPRNDGTMTGRLSHLDGETVRLLQQIGVRYAVFNRDQYRADDWPAVQAELDRLTEEGLLQAAGTFGRQAIFVVNPMAPAPAPPRVALFAPTLLAAGAPWSPWVGVEAETSPSLLALTRPAQLSLTWYDGDGKRLFQNQQVLPLPAVMDEPVLLCDARECLTSRPFADPRRLPAPRGVDAWAPEGPGHFVVDARLTGDTPLSCRIDLDIVADEADVADRSGDNPYRWAACVPEAPFPVNNPGLPPFGRSDARVTLAGDTLGVEFTVTPRNDEILRAWFILSPRGLAEPWRHASFQPAPAQRMAPGGEAQTFAWSEAVGDSLAPGAYDVSVWVHHLAAGAWEHATGGLASTRSVIVDDEGTLRWAGPLLVRQRDNAAPLLVGGVTHLPLTIEGITQPEACRASWRLSGANGVDRSGTFASCLDLAVVIPEETPPGTYLLTVEAYTLGEGEARLSDGITLPVAVATPP
ncbi:MAG: DUF2029 domain-containing protein, partial [Thermomicrobiales bacterium]|nr:DUF2029 domain-containing protein [Thermomicrobiales bacterium]